MGIEGTVTLRVRITKTGDVGELTVVKGDPALTAEAVRAAQQWRYTPCLVESKPVDVVTTLYVGFSLRQ